MLQKKLETLFAWVPFGVIQFKDWGNWIAKQASEHPDVYELVMKIIGTVICATVYHFVMKFWKNRDEKNPD